MHRRELRIRTPHSALRIPGAFRLPPAAVRIRGGRGFTLIELMVVIAIISLLVALILPAISRARVAAQEAKVIVEIKQLDSAIAAFKAKYGVEPPSRISIWLSQAGWTSDPASMAIIRGIWPQFDFTMTMPDPANPGNTRVACPKYWSTIAAPSGTSTVINLNSGECLLFFLGGVMGDAASNSPAAQQAGSLATQAPTGFAKNPQYPFAPTSVVTNREGPFFEGVNDVTRVRDIDGNGINEFYDSLPGQSKPYLYFSSYDGQGYRTSELPNDGTNFKIAGNESLHDVYRVYASTGLYPLKNVAAITSPGGTSADPTVTTAQKSQTFQIISPGYDTEYGSGGVFNPNLANSGLVGFDSSENPISPDPRQYDNLTNFNAGRLRP